MTHRKRLHQQRRVQPIGCEIHQQGRAGKPNCDTAPPLHFGACHHRSAIYFQSTSTLHHAYPAWLLTATGLPAATLLAPALSATAAHFVQTQTPRSLGDILFITGLLGTEQPLSGRSIARVLSLLSTKPACFTWGIKIPRVAS